MKKWCRIIILAWLIIVIIWGGMVYLVDPYFHFHAPIKGLSYRFDKPYQQNDGIAKNFDYDSLITGTSTSVGCRIDVADELWDRKFTRISFLGGSFKMINMATKRALKSNPELKLVIRGLDPIWFVTGPDWLGNNEYPEYLYDDDIWNDTQYLYNFDVFAGDVIPELIRTVKDVKPENLDELSDTKDGEFEYTRGEKMNLAMEDSETKNLQVLLAENIAVNVLENVKDYPDVQFAFYIPPYSIAWWDAAYLNYGTDAIKRRISFEKYVYEQLLQYDNVKVYAFNDCFDMICNTTNYVDEIHYKERINTQLLEWIHDGKHEITTDNYRDYIDRISEFYTSFDYDAFFSE